MKNCYKLFDGWEASFSVDWSDYQDARLGEYLTFCVIRKTHTKAIYSGCAVHNPIDDIDGDKGKKVAFGRALDVMLPKDMLVNNTYQRKRIHDLRKKFWDAFLPQL
jgi:hypothetical protein